MSKTSQRESSGPSQDEDPQFLRDLEEAKRLSLETFGDEFQKRVSQPPIYPDIIRPIKGSSMISSQPQPSPPPIGFNISPRPFSSSSMNMNGNVRYPNANNVIPFSSMNTKQIGFQGVTRSQSYPYGNFNAGTTLVKNDKTPNPNHNIMQNNFGFHIGNHMSSTSTSHSDNQRKSSTIIDPTITTSTYNAITTTTVLPNIEELRKRSPTPKNKNNIYCQLTEEVRSLSDDLIDLGPVAGQVDDSKNILEVFDPLFDNYMDKISHVPQNSSSTPSSSYVSKSGVGDTPINNVDKLVDPPQLRSITKPGVEMKQDKVDVSDGAVGGADDRNNDEYVSLVGSRSSSSYGWKSDMSLYPTLPSSTSAVYETIHADGDFKDPSILYDAYNQLEYLYAVSVSSESSSFYWHPNDASPYSSIRLPSPAATTVEPKKFSYGLTKSPSIRSSNSTENRRSADFMKRRGKLYEDITSLKKQVEIDGELIAFVDMLQNLKLSIRLTTTKQPKTYISSPTGPSQCWKEGLSLKIIVWNETFTMDSVTFTCDVTSPVLLVIEQTLTKLEVDGNGRDYILRVNGLDAYLDSEKTLIEFRYIQECIKLDEDVRLVLVHRDTLSKISWSRPTIDDTVETLIQPELIMPSCNSKVITFTEISNFLEVIDKESDKFNEKFTDAQTMNCVNPTPLMQTVKGICVLLGDIETVEIRKSLLIFTRDCEQWNTLVQTNSNSTATGQTPSTSRRTVVVSDVSSRHSYVEIIKEEKSSQDIQKENIIRTKDNVIEAVRMLIEMYSTSFPVSFKMNSPLEANLPDTCTDPKKMSEMLDPFLIRISALHRIKPEWGTTYLDYFIVIEVFHGTKALGKQASPISVAAKTDDTLFFNNTVIVDSWMDFEHLPICILPRECRLVFSVFGRKMAESGETHVVNELGWASIQCFDFQGFFMKGNQLLPLWQVGMPQKRLGPAPNSAFSYDLNVPLITIEFPDFGRNLKFADIPSGVHVRRDFQSLDNNTQIQLKDIIENTTFTKFPAEDREVLWEKRHYLHSYPTALPKVLLSAQFWDFASLSELHLMMDNWSPLPPSSALQLLLPCFPDAKVRQTAIKWISEMADEDLITVLPQLVEALSYETFDLSPLAEFLLQKSLSSFEIAHSLFWNLVSEVGLGNWGDADICTDGGHPGGQSDPRKRRLELMRNSLIAISYHKWKHALISEFKLMQGLCDVTTQVKLAPTSQRSVVMTQELKEMNIHLFGGNTTYSLPLSPAYVVTTLEPENCICFNSASVPLKINFKSGLPEGGVIPVLFKQGDDIRQDMLTIQVIRMIENWWLKDGLDLRVVTFSCVPTGYKQGVVEIVSNAETLCKIQADYGVTGAFRDRPIFEWLAKMNPSTLDYRRAVENFTRSCAAYCVLTYILGICDRHNDNIMLTNKGHLFHIDFGKFLGDAQMFGSFKRDRAPFVLTSDMLYVINDGEKVSQRFHKFVELCCNAFRIVRQNGDVLMNLFAMMATAGIPGVDIKSVAYIQNALLPDCSNVEAAARFTRFIEDSLRNWFTPVNFFIHSLAQLRFASETTDNPSTLSFIPRMYSMDSEGRIVSATIIQFQKKYDPEKYYSYTVKVQRKDQVQASLVNRSYKQFLELYTKLCMNFPMAIRSLRALPRSSGIGRSNVKQVAEKRKCLLKGFLDSLFRLADEISHSALVYTFFHPLLKDEEYNDLDINRTSQALERSLLSPVKIHGSIKACIQYSKGALLVLVLHAFDLACPNSQPPSTYVKSYLQPDPSRLTKRKTRVVKRSQHPTFMEMIEYRLPLEVIVKRILELSVWHHDPLQENSFLGGISIPLKSCPLEKETTQTFSLGNLLVTP